MLFPLSFCLLSLSLLNTSLLSHPVNPSTIYGCLSFYLFLFPVTLLLRIDISSSKLIIYDIEYKLHFPLFRDLSIIIHVIEISNPTLSSWSLCLPQMHPSPRPSTPSFLTAFGYEHMVHYRLLIGPITSFIDSKSSISLKSLISSRTDYKKLDTGAKPGLDLRRRIISELIITVIPIIAPNQWGYECSRGLVRA